MFQPDHQVDRNEELTSRYCLVLLSGMKDSNPLCRVEQFLSFHYIYDLNIVLNQENFFAPVLKGCWLRKW